MIKTQRLMLRDLRCSDYQQCLTLWTETGISGQPVSPEGVRSLLDYYRRHLRQHGYSMYAVLLRSTRQLIGNCGLEHYQWPDFPEIQLAYDIHPEYRRQGFATEAAAAITAYAFRVLKVEKLVCYIETDNTPSLHVATSLGFSPERKTMQDGKLHVVYSLSRVATESVTTLSSIKIRLSAKERFCIGLPESLST